jgi:hypothetical protein
MSIGGTISVGGNGVSPVPVGRTGVLGLGRYYGALG